MILTVFTKKSQILNSLHPLTFNDATKGKDKEQWLDVINNELENLYTNNIMTFVTTIPPGKKSVSTKWVFNIKKDGNNNITKYMVRLVARGFNQVRGFDYELTFSPTLNIDSLKLILALAAKNKWNTHQLDIKSTYINASLNKEIIITILPGDMNYNQEFLEAQ